MAELTERARTVRLLEQAVGYGLAAVAAVPPGALHRPTPCASWDLEHLLLHLRESVCALQEAPDLGRVTLLPPAAGCGGAGADLGEPAAGRAVDLAAGGPRVAGSGRGAEGAGPAAAGPTADGPAGGRGGRPAVEGAAGAAADGAVRLAEAVREDVRGLLESWRRWAALPGPSCAWIRVAGMPLPGDTVAFVGAVELAVHGWDIAQACGRPRPIPVPLALAILRRAPLVADPSTRPVLFAAPVAVPALASPSDRLLAYLGRLPRGPG